MYDEMLLTMVEALTSWLTFEAECGREGAFEEKYLLNPVFQILDRHYQGQVRTNLAHPQLLNKEKVDFAVVTNEPHRWEIAIETKWLDAQSTRSEKALTRIAKDLLRLELIARHCHCEHAWFLLGGRTELFSELWYKNMQYGESEKYRLAARHLLPSNKSKIGLDPEILHVGKPEPAHRPTVRNIVAVACADSLRGLEVGHNFYVHPEMPFSRCSLDDPGTLPYRLPPHKYAVYGWRVCAAERTFAPTVEFTLA